MSEVSVEALDRLVIEIMEARKEVEVQQAILTEKNKKVMELEGKAVAHLKETGREKYQTPFGTIRILNRWRVNLPKTSEDKKALFDFLREREIFDTYATVNSNSLNSFYMKEWEAAQQRGEGMTFSMPGIKAPSLFESFSLRDK